MYSDSLDVRSVGPNYRELISEARKFAPEHVPRLLEEYLLSRVNSPSTLDSDMVYGYSNPKYTDVTFVVGDAGNQERVPAHAVVLAARSQYFRAMFLGGLRIDRSKDIVLAEVSPVAFRQILRYLYVGSVDFNEVEREGTIVDLYTLSKRFHSPKLERFVEDVLSYSLSPENAVSILLLAEQQDSESLRKKTVDFFYKNRVEVEASEDFSDSSELVESIAARYSAPISGV